GPSRRGGLAPGRAAGGPYRVVKWGTDMLYYDTGASYSQKKWSTRPSCQRPAARGAGRGPGSFRSGGPGAQPGPAPGAFGATGLLPPVPGTGTFGAIGLEIGAGAGAGAMTAAAASRLSTATTRWTGRDFSLWCSQPNR